MNSSSINANDSVAHRSLGPLRLVRLQGYGLQGYGLAVLSVGVALGVALLIGHFHFRDAAVPLLLFAVAITSWYGGPGPVVLSVALSSLCLDYFFVEPLYTFSIAPLEIPYFVIFALFAVLVSWFGTIRRRAEADLRQARDKLKALNQDLARRSAELEASNKELEAFAYSVSHDLRAPLRHMAGFGELLRNSSAASLNENSRRYLTVILEAANRMGTLIDDLLAFSGISRAEAHYSTVSLEQIVQEAIAEVRQDANERKIVWKIDSLPEWYGDRSMLRLVMVNLISNAVKFTRARSEAEIEIGSTRRRNDELVVFVRDNGVGFDMKYSHKLFGVFQRLHPQEAFEGTGIGLATVQRIVLRHGGRVWAESKVEGGATFYFSLSRKGDH
jgi:signal transduction histidine kinase